jgi:DNA-binding NtrC family response regulator
MSIEGAGTGHWAPDRMNRTVLLVDDDRSVLEALSALLQTDGWDVATAATGKEAIGKFDALTPDVVLLDVALPDVSGVQVLELLKQRSESTPVIMISGAGTIDVVVECVKRGAETFLQKPFGHEALLLAMEQVERLDAARRALTALRRSTRPGEVAGYIGESPAARKVRDLIEAVSDAPTPVLIEGETGTGKGLVARLIHNRSRRAKRPYVDLNCAGLSKELLESELFGHEKGAFTGATSSKPGLLEIAGGGTMFLDEIGELDPAVQSRLLKALEEKRYRRVGGVRDLTGDFRLIAATNRSLAGEVASGHFRRDLFYRINVVRLELPPLRERREDIPILAEVFAARVAGEIGKATPRLTPRALAKLQSHHWPGNVRELRNALERAILLSTGNELFPEHFSMGESPEPVFEPSGLPISESQIAPLDQVVTEYLRAAVEAAGGNMRKAARLLRISPSTLYQKLRNPRSR